LNTAVDTGLTGAIAPLSRRDGRASTTPRSRLASWRLSDGPRPLWLVSRDVTQALSEQSSVAAANGMATERTNPAPRIDANRTWNPKQRNLLINP